MGIVITVYAENSAVIAYTDENGKAMRKMVYVNDPENVWQEMSGR